MLHCDVACLALQMSGDELVDHRNSILIYQIVLECVSFELVFIPIFFQNTSPMSAVTAAFEVKAAVVITAGLHYRC